MTLISAPWVLAVVAWTATWMTSKRPPLMQPRCVCSAASGGGVGRGGLRARACARWWGRALHQLVSTRANSGVMTKWGDGMGEEQLWHASTLGLSSRVTAHSKCQQRPSETKRPTKAQSTRVHGSGTESRCLGVAAQGR
jgi:hypothetical protein